MIKQGIILGMGIAFLNALISMLSLKWALPKSDKFFLWTFYGNMFWKLLVLAGLAVYLIKNFSSYLNSTLISLAIMTLLFNILEAGLFLKQSH